MKLHTRAIAIVLMLVMALPLFVFTASAKEITVTANGFDIARESGALVIYTPKMGATTGTNAWGYEVIIVDNVATEFKTGNSTIPENGFVLSGHNEDSNNSNASNMGLWIQNNISIGDYVYYTPNGVITVSDVPVAASVFYSINQDIIGVNVTRQENALVVYNTGGSTTGTNDWGYEVVVTDGVVTSLGGNNNTIPQGFNSFVVSGHGTASVWLQDNVSLGMRSTYSVGAKTVTFSYDEEAAISGMQLRLDELEDSYEAALKRYDYFDYKAVKTAIDQLAADLAAAENAYRSNNDSLALVESCEAFETSADNLDLAMGESRTVEYRGVWIRPTDTSAEQVDATVQELYDNGINMVCIETLYNNTMIMPMPEDSLFEVNPKFAHYDMLQAYIDACHKRGMELHLWLPVFHVGNYGSQYASLSVGTKKPEWLSLSNTGKTHEVCEGYYMLDPGNVEVQDYLLNTYKYILDTYDVDGLQLDYIRYFVRTSEYDMGYNQSALDAFEAEYGVVPQYDTTASYWNDWVEFRCRNITDFVGRVRKLLDAVAPDVLLGADVVPNADGATEYNYQDYYTWLENGWLDILFPMAYGFGYEADIAAQVERCGDDAFLAVGLGIFMSELDAAVMQDQTNYNTSVYAEGSVFFESTAYLKKGTGEYLANGAYANDAITPTYDKAAAAKAQIDYAKARISEVILPLGGVSEEGANAVISALDAFAETITEDGYDEAAYEKINTVINEANMMSDASNRIKKDVRSAVKAYLIANKKTDTSGVTELPDELGVSEPDASVDNEAPADNASGTTSDSGNDSGMPSSAIAIIVIVVVAVIGVAAVVIITKKK